MIELNGTPNEINSLIVSDSLLEYQYNLVNTFPTYKTEKIYIKELFWKNDKKNMTVWLAKEDTVWISVDNLIWDDNVKF